MAGWSEQLDSLSALVALLGLVYVLGGVTLWVVELAPAAETAHRALYQLVVHVLFGGVILALGVHVERSDPLAEERYSVLVWCYGGFTLMFVLATWGHLGSILAGDLTVEFVSDFVVFTSLGGAFGVIAGVNRGRATRNRRLAERNEEQRETLALLTRLVSHDIRNDIGIMRGYAELLEEDVDDDNRYALEVIQDRADDSIVLLEDASTLVQTLNEDREFEQIDLSRVLEKEARSLSQANPETAVETDVPSGLIVKADHLIRQLFSNLLENAIAHNDPADLTVTVQARQEDGYVAVVVADDGSGIPPERREEIFELGEKGAGSSGDGIGLYLVSRLARIYGGSVTVEESPAGGAAFRVELPTATR